jgi:hypothetical protein
MCELMFIVTKNLPRWYLKKMFRISRCVEPELFLLIDEIYSVYDVTLVDTKTMSSELTKIMQG